MNLLKKSHQGMILPVMVVLLAIFSIIGLIVFKRFSGIGNKEYMAATSNSQLYNAAMSGIQLTTFELKRPDNPALATEWDEHTMTSKTFTFDGIKVEVTVEHGYLGH